MSFGGGAGNPLKNREYVTVDYVVACLECLLLFSECHDMSLCGHVIYSVNTFTRRGGWYAAGYVIPQPSDTVDEPSYLSRVRPNRVIPNQTTLGVSHLCSENISPFSIGLTVRYSSAKTK